MSDQRLDVAVEEFAGVAEHAAALDADPLPARRVPLPTRDGLRLSAIEWDDGDHEAVLLHGGSQNAHTWNGVVLAAGLRALAVDLPGHGHSDWYPDGRYALDRLADSIADALESRLPARPVLVGHSISGILALLVARRLPDRFRALVVVDSEPSGLRGIGPAIAYQGPFEKLVAAVTPDVDRVDLEAIRRGVRLNAVPLPGDDWRWRWDPRFRGSQPLWPAEEPAVRRAAAELDLPVLGVRGERSRPVRPDIHRAFFAGLREARVAVAPGAGHNVQSDATRWLAEAIRDVVDGRTVGTPAGEEES